MQWGLCGHLRMESLNAPIKGGEIIKLQSLRAKNEAGDGVMEALAFNFRTWTEAGGSVSTRPAYTE